MIDLWEYDITNGTWAQKYDFQGGARYFATGFSIGGKGYIGFGTDEYTSHTSTKKDLWEYDPDANSWVQKHDLPGRARIEAVGFSIGNRGYIGTGGSAGELFPDSSFRDFWEYDPIADDWTQKDSLPGPGGNRWGAVGFSVGGKGYIGSGTVAGALSADTKNDLWEFDPATGHWTAKSDLPGGGRFRASCFAIGGRGFVAAGAIGAGYTDVLLGYDPVVDHWDTLIADSGITSRAAGVGASANGSGFFGLGFNGNTQGDFWQYDFGVPPCISSQLTTTSDPIVSCGASHLLLNGSSTLWATPVPLANKYQFHFTNNGGPSYSRNIAVHARSLTLVKWYTSPLKPGRSYNVQVRASFDDGLTWCPFGSSCTISTSYGPGEEERSFAPATDEDMINIWPNPSNGAELHIAIPGSVDDPGTIRVEVIDAFGRNMLTRILFSEGDPSDVALAFTSPPAKGMYFVKVTHQDQVTTRRLVIE